jgi:hypothetical protein
VLRERFGAAVPEALLPAEAFHPYPRAGERAAWEALAPALREGLVAAGEEAAARPWPALSATGFLDYRRTGDRARYEALHHGRREILAALVLAECAEGRGRFLDPVADAVWSLCEESFWGVPAHNDAEDPLPDVERPIFDLFAGETGALLAWTDYLLGAELARVSARLRARLRAELDRRLLTPFLTRDDFWWMGLRGGRVNNWNPWCVSNALAVALAVPWPEPRRVAAVQKALLCLDRFLDPHPRDGGCDEGPSYWDRAAGSLFDGLELLRLASGGRLDAFDEPLVAEMGRFLYRVHIADDWFVAFADSPARVSISADLVHRFGERVGDPDLAALGAWAHGRRQDRRPRGSLGRALPAVFHWADLEQAAEGAAPPYPAGAWLPEVQVLVARERAGSPQGLFLAAKGGHNGESHNHNDVGTFLVYLDGCPAVVDAGVGTYTAQTFGPDRYLLWTMRSAYHNVPQVRGVEQRAGPAFAARAVEGGLGPDGAALHLELAQAYPAEAGIATWRRAVRLRRRGREGAVVEVEDAFRLEAPTEDVRLHLLVAGEPRAVAPGRLRIPTARGALDVVYEAGVLAWEAETIPLDDPRLRRVWGDRLWRVALRAQAPVGEAVWRLELTRSA